MSKMQTERVWRRADGGTYLGAWAKTKLGAYVCEDEYVLAGERASFRTTMTRHFGRGADGMPNRVADLEDVARLSGVKRLEKK